MGDCSYCGKAAGFLRRKHGACASAHEHGLAEMRSLAAAAAKSADFNKAALRENLVAVAVRCWRSLVRATSATCSRTWWRMGCWRGPLYI